VGFDETQQVNRDETEWSHRKLVGEEGFREGPARIWPTGSGDRSVSRFAFWKLTLGHERRVFTGTTLCLLPSSASRNCEKNSGPDTCQCG